MCVTLKNINEQTIVVTGASSGIGLATAETAARRGARVVLAARSEETLREVAKRISIAGGQATYAVCDVADRGQVQSVADTAIALFGHIDTWINNAGVSIYGRIEEVSEADSRRLFDTNFWGIVNGSLVAIPHLKHEGGALINVGSEVSESVVPLQGMYSASKHAVKGFTDALRIELQSDKVPISVTLIQPTAVDTPYPQHARNYMDKEPKLPSPMIDPQKVAEVILSAAIKPTHHVKVGMMAKIDTFVANNAPSIGDWMSSRQMDRQHQDEPPRDPEGTLFIPGESGEIYGTTGRSDA